MYVNKTYYCDYCESKFDWEKIYAVHLKHIHRDDSYKPLKRKSLTDCEISILKFVQNLTPNPRLRHVARVAKKFDIDKEQAYIFFKNASRSKK